MTSVSCRNCRARVIAVPPSRAPPARGAAEDRTDLEEPQAEPEQADERRGDRGAPTRRPRDLRRDGKRPVEIDPVVDEVPPRLRHLLQARRFLPRRERLSR